MNKRKIFVVGGETHYANWMQGDIVNNIEFADLVVFTGGLDVSPSLYGQLPHPTTSFNTVRDIKEAQIFRQAQKYNKHIIGICRGSQFLCVMNEGILIQHQENPSYLHPIKLFDNDDIIISSTHHQAAYPFLLPKENYKVLGFTDGLSKYHYGQSYNEKLNPPVECEIVYYPKTKCLGIQGHPEGILEMTDTISYLRNLLDRFMKDSL